MPAPSYAIFDGRRPLVDRYQTKRVRIGFNDIEREKLKLLPAVFETQTAPQTNKSVDDIMAPLTAPAKPAAATTDAKMPIAD